MRLRDRDRKTFWLRRRRVYHDAYGEPMAEWEAALPMRVCQQPALPNSDRRIYGLCALERRTLYYDGPEAVLEGDGVCVRSGAAQEPDFCAVKVEIWDGYQRIEIERASGIAQSGRTEGARRSVIRMQAADQVLDERLEAVKLAVRRAAAQAIRLTAEAIAEDARRLAPCESGALRASIEAECTEGTDGSVARVRVGVPYGAAVELGLGGNIPQPYLYPAFAANRERAAQAVHDALLT